MISQLLYIFLTRKFSLHMSSKPFHVTTHRYTHSFNLHRVRCSWVYAASVFPFHNNRLSSVSISSLSHEILSQYPSIYPLEDMLGVSIEVEFML